MVDVGDKENSVRIVVVCAFIYLGEEAFYLVEVNKIKKGDVFFVVQLVGIMVVKKIGELVLLCYNIGLSKVLVDLILYKYNYFVYIECEVKIVGKIGVEMEVIIGVFMVVIIVYDMCKVVNREMVIFNIRLFSKKGGKSGEYQFVFE